MNNHLFFIPRIADALREDDTNRVLKEAFRDIQDAGSRMSNPIPLEQYRAFMAEVHASLHLEFSVHRDGVPVGRTTAHSGGGLSLLTGITPGLYELYLSTGRLVWQGTLTDEDVLWHIAFPRENLRMAADSGGGTDGPPSRTEVILGGDAELLVFAGVSAGRLGIRLRTQTRRE